MELDPVTENGKYLSVMLNKRLQSGCTATATGNQLQRVFVMYASQVENQDSFVGSLYGQGVVDELNHLSGSLSTTPLELVSAKSTCVNEH